MEGSPKPLTILLSTTLTMTIGSLERFDGHGVDIVDVPVNCPQLGVGFRAVGVVVS